MITESKKSMKLIPSDIDRQIKEEIDKTIEKWSFLREERYGLYHEMLAMYIRTGEVPEIIVETDS